MGELGVGITGCMKHSIGNGNMFREQCMGMELYYGSPGKAPNRKHSCQVRATEYLLDLIDLHME